MIHLTPIQIFFSQDSINNVFDCRSRHSDTLIGETLDDICERRCSISKIPTISVAKVDGRWVTADNRRLWVFRQLYRLNKCDTVPVHITYSIPAAKMTSYNKGVSIEVRRGPGGRWHRKSSVRSSVPTLPTSKPPIVQLTVPEASVYAPSRPDTIFGISNSCQIASTPNPMVYSSWVSNPGENIQTVDDIIKSNIVPVAKPAKATSVYFTPTSLRETKGNVDEPLRANDIFGIKGEQNGTGNDSQLKETGRMGLTASVQDDRVTSENKTDGGNEEIITCYDNTIASDDETVARTENITTDHVSIPINEDDINMQVVAENTANSTPTTPTKRPEVERSANCCVIARIHPFKTVGIIALVVTVVVTAVVLGVLL